MEKQSTRKFLKLFVALVALFLLGSSALLLSSCKEEHTHDWGEGTVTVQPTCTAQGFKTFECSCGAVRTEPIQATGHKWDEGKVTTEPTCQPGVKTYTCQNCGETKTESIAATTGHEWVLNEELTVAPTCAKDGVKFYECANCGATQEIVDPATGNHEYNYEYIDASCEEWGIVIITCKNCTYYKQETDSSKPPLEHNYIVNTDDPNYVAPTCVSQGYGTFECTRCNDTYAGPIAALTTNGQHDWIANTDTDDTLTGFALGNDYANVDEAKAAGWTTVTVQNCTTNGVFQRVCDRCGEVETKNALATGHKPAGYDTWYATLEGDAKTAHDALSHAQKLNAYFQDAYDAPYGVCMKQPTLTDAQGNEYAFECVNPNCPCEVVINSYGETANLVPAVAHTWTNANGTEIAWLPIGDGATCTEDGEEHRFCPVCGFEDVREVEALDHAWNTIQLNGRTEALVCNPDGYLTDEANADQQKALIDAIDAYYKDDAYAASAIIDKIQKTLSDPSNSGKTYSRFCFRCGELEEAKEHEYVVSKLSDVYDLNSYETDEDGNIVAQDFDSTDARFTCAYVLVCKNCGTPDHAGAHGTFTTATCREGSECPICHRPGAGQLKHQYVTMTDVLNENTAANANPKGHADSEEVKINGQVVEYNGKNVTYGQLRAAYEKLKGDETWMEPVTATCTSAGTEVYICYTCLLDAAAGVEFDWTTGTTDKAPQNGYEYCAYTQATSDGHVWTPVYYKTSATDPAVDTPINRALTSCESGFKVAYQCSVCKQFFIKTLVVDDKDTAADETDANALGTNEPAYTNEKGFAINPNAYTSGAEGFVTTIENNQAITEQNIADILAYVDDHRGQHVVFIPANYKELAGQYLAPTCVEEATLPVVCINCGAQLEYTYDRIAAQLTDSDDEEKFTFANSTQVANYLDIEVNDLNKDGVDAYVIEETVFAQASEGNSGVAGALAAEARVNPDNHANQPFACGDHCNAYVLGEDGTTKYYCSGFDTNGDSDQYWYAQVVDAEKADLNENDHTTVTVTFQLSSRLEKSYLTGYVLNIAVVETNDFKADGSIDWTKVDFVTSDKIAKCAGGNAARYDLPELYPEDGLTKGEISETTNYFVLLKDGVPYPITIQYNVYNEDPETTFTEAVKATMVYGKWGEDSSLLDNAYVTAPQGDHYFVDFGYGSSTSDVTRPGVPTDAEDSKSLLLAAQNPVITTTTTRTIYNINFVDAVAGAEPMNWTLAADGSNLYSFYTAIAAYGTAEKPAEVVVDLGGNTVVLNMATAMLFNDAMFGNNVAKITFANGGFSLTSLTGENYAFSFNFDDKVDSTKLVYERQFVFDNFDVLSTANAITLAADMTGNVLFVNGSTVTAYGTYGISIDDSDATEPAARNQVLTIDGSTVTVTMNPATLVTDPDANWALSTALFVGAPVSVEVRNGSTLSAAGQAVVVRQGTVKIANTTLKLVAGHTDGTAQSAGLDATDALNITSKGYYDADTNVGLAYNAGRTLQYYRQYGAWAEEGNGVVRAVIVVGNSSADSYQLATDVTLNNITISNAVADAEDLEIAARYGVASTDAPATGGTVNFSWSARTVSQLKSCVTDNSIASLITINSQKLGQ
mgnify:CR=1 FL=1